jgi:hypothetical protein
MHSLTEAQLILKNRQPSGMVLTVEFAQRMNTVLRHLPDDISVNLLYWGTSQKDSRAGEAWLEFILSLTPYERGTITRTLAGLTKYTVGQIRSASVRTLMGWKVREITASFYITAFQR